MWCHFSICGIISGNHITLDFTLFELINILLGILIIGYIPCDGVINWLEVTVTVVYVIIAEVSSSCLPRLGFDYLTVHDDINIILCEKVD